MIVTLPSSVQRALALALLILVIASLWTLFIQPFVNSWEQASESDARSAKLLVKYRDVLGRQEEWLTLDRKLREGSYGHAFVEGSDANLAAAKFQADMKQAIEGSNASVTSVQVLPATKDHDVTQLNEQVTISAPLAALPGLVRQVEQRVPYVFIDSFSVTAPENIPVGAPVQLTISCTFHAYLIPEAL